MRFPRYPSYKDSGVQWLGKIPEHWEAKRLEYYFGERKEKVSDKDFRALSVTNKGIVPQLDTAAKTDDGDNRKKVCRGDFVINGRSDRKGSSGVSDLDGSVSLINIVLRPRSVIHAAFVHHLLRSRPFQEEFYRYGKGIVADLWSTSYSEMRNILLAMPDLDEQARIASVLDRETAKIGALIADQQRLIELLKEKRQTVISHALTKGLNPDAPTKPSGVDWLGDVPAHWEVKRIKAVLSDVKAGPFGSSLTKDMYVNSGYRVYGQEQVIPSDFTVGDYFVEESKYEELAQYRVQPGDILISCVGTFGKIAIVPADVEPGIINPRLIRLRCTPDTNEKYLAEVLRCHATFEQFKMLSRGGTMDVINIGTLSEIIVVLPPIEEQVQLLRFVSDEQARIDMLSFEIQKAVDLLQERRTVLVSAAITGKIDVRSSIAVAAA